MKKEKISKWTLNVQGKYYKSGNKRTDDVEKADSYVEISYLYKYAVEKHFIHNNKPVYGANLVRLIFEKENDEMELVGVIDYGEMWNCFDLIDLGAKMERAKIAK